MIAQTALAEGSYQVGTNQYLYEYAPESPNGLLSNTLHPLYLNLESANEVINISLCTGVDALLELYETSNPTINFNTVEAVGYEIYTESGLIAIASGSLSSGETEPGLCSNDLSTGNLNPNANFRWSPADDGYAAGTYRIHLIESSYVECSDFNCGAFQNDTFRRFDLTVTSNKLTNPNPREVQGRLFAYNWSFNANNYTTAEAADSKYYIKVPGGRPNTDFVWFLDLQEFAGFVYDITANDLGVNASNTLYSVPFTGNSITEKYPIYLNYPVDADDPPSQPPQISQFMFVDDAGVDNTITPGTTLTVQDSGTFSFVSDVAGTYLIVLDANQDGVFGNTVSGVDDLYLFGSMSTGNNSIVWDGKDGSGATLADGVYQAQLQARIGEYHFVAGDAETSGGGVDDGLTIYGVNPDGSLYGTAVFWDDLTGFDPDKAGNGGSTLPYGEVSVVGQTTGAFRHTWGNFTFDSFGNTAYVDTYVYGLASYSSTTAIINSDDSQSHLGLGKTASVDGNEVTFDFYLENFLPSSLSELSLIDHLEATFGAGNYTVAAPTLEASTGSVTININPDYDGSSDQDLLLDTSTLGGNATVHLRMLVTITKPTDRGFGLGVYENVAFVSSKNTSGVLVTDISTNSTDPDSDNTESDGVSVDGGTGSNDGDDQASNNTEPTPVDLLLDLGDAPDAYTGTGTGEYKTRAQEDGPMHFIKSGLVLGSLIDSDNGQLQNSAATADDNDAIQDEDGVSFNSSLSSSDASYSVSVELSNLAGDALTLLAWIDFDQSGTFDADEVTSLSGALSGTQTLTWPSIPNDVVAGTSYARFRLTTQTLTDNGATNEDERSIGTAVDGEVEDYALTIVQDYDFGDAPDDYKTLLASDGARHGLALPKNLFLGSLAPDDETDASAGADADGDDSTAGGATDDEDSFGIFPILTPKSTEYSLSVPVNNATASAATLYAWIDFDQDDTFEASEAATVTVNPSDTTVTLEWSAANGNAPPTLSVGTTYLRLRLTSDALADNAGTSAVDERAQGAASDGEVEDYRLEITGFDVSGVVYHDLEPDLVQGPSEDWSSGVTVYVNLVNATNAVVASKTIDPSSNPSGSYLFEGVPPGDYSIVVTDSAVNNAALRPSEWLFVSPNTGSRDVVVVDEDLTEQDFGLFKGSLVSGTVFYDDGLVDSGGAPAYSSLADANNALQSISEAGVPGVIVTASDGSSSYSTETDGAGNYQLYLPASLGSDVRVSHSLQVGTGTSIAGATLPACLAMSLDDTAAREQLMGDLDCSDAIDGSETGFEAGQSYADYDFGLVLVSRLSPDQSAQASSPDSVDYTHLYTPGTLGAVTPSVNNGRYTYQLFLDSDCDGVVEDAERSDVLSSGWTVDASWPRTSTGQLASCALELRVMVPEAEPNGRVDIVFLEASLAWENNISINDARSITDITTVSNGSAVTVLKQVRNLSEGGSFAVRNEAEPGQTLEYCITYQNVGLENILSFEVSDPLPYYTSFLSDAYDTGIGDQSIQWNSSSTSLLTEAKDADAAEFENGFVQLAVGTLVPGETGSLCYQVNIE